MYLRSIVAAAALAVLAAPAVAVPILDETDERDTGVQAALGGFALNFDGYGGAGTVVGVDVRLDAVLDGSTSVTLSNGNVGAQNASGTVSTNFSFSSAVDLPANPAQLSGTTPIFSVPGGGRSATRTISAGDSETTNLSFTGADIAQFLTPFTVSVSASSTLAVSGPAGVSGSFADFLRAVVRVEYLIDDMSPGGDVPLPASAIALASGLAGIGLMRRRRQRGAA